MSTSATVPRPSNPPDTDAVPRMRGEAIALLGAAPAIAVMVWFASDEGGYRPAQWYAGALVLLGLCVALLAVRRAGAVRHRASAVFIGALVAYAALSYASVTWADSPGTALQGSHRTAAYVAAAVALCLLPWSARALSAALGAWVLGVTAVAIATLVRLGTTETPLDLFNGGRLAEPLGYHNATAALWTAAAATALVIASRRDHHAAARVAALAAAGVLLEMAVLSQSRGWLVSLPVVAVLLLAVTPNRIRLLLHALPVGVAVLVALPRLLDPYEAVGVLPPAEQARALLPTFDPLIGAVALSALALAVAGAVLVGLDRRVVLSAGVQRASGRVAAALAVVAVVAGLAAALAVTDGQPVERVRTTWADFKDFDGETVRANRFQSIETSRYEIWRVAAKGFADRPVLGLGQDNFAQAYMVQRANAIEEPRWTHSLQLRLLAHTGIVGALLFLAALAAAGWSVVRRRASRAESGARAAAVAPLLVWLVHGSVDWLWEFPGLSIPALAFAGAATAVGAPRASARAFPRVVRPAAVVLAVLTAAAIVPAYLAEREVSTAAQTWPTEPGTARARLDRAERLAPLDARPLLVGAIIAQRSADLPAARRLFRKAADREPLDWFSRFELGLVAGVQGDRRYAARALRESRRLNPRDPVVRTALDRLRRGRPMSFAEAERAFTTRVQRRLGRDPDGVR